VNKEVQHNMQSIPVEYAHILNGNYATFWRETQDVRLSLLWNYLYKRWVQSFHRGTVEYFGCVQVFSCHVYGCWKALLRVQSYPVRQTPQVFPIYYKNRKFWHTACQVIAGKKVSTLTCWESVQNLLWASSDISFNIIFLNFESIFL
jgi:hypothetical protein